MTYVITASLEPSHFRYDVLVAEIRARGEDGRTKHCIINDMRQQITQVLIAAVVIKGKGYFL